MLLGAFATNVWAYDGSTVAPSGQTIYYNYNSSSQTIEITYPNINESNPWVSFTKPTGVLVIPDSVTHNGIAYPVTAIGSSAFCTCTDLTSVTMGGNVATIGGNAFKGCNQMTSIVIGSNVTTIGTNAFYMCTSLSSVTIPDAVNAIGSYSFSDCYGLVSVNFGSGLTSIGGYAFQNCTDLPSIVIPDNVATIGAYAFYGCTSLAYVTIGSGVTTIGGNAFMCGLEEMHIHKSVPPTLQSYPTFPWVDSAYLYVPCGATAAYQSGTGTVASQWRNRFIIAEEFTYTFSATNADTVGGNVHVIQAPDCGNMQAVVQAIADSGYYFTHWSDGNTSNPRTLTVVSDTAIVAYFASDSGVVYIHDTVFIHDTTIIIMHDTTYVPVHDTTVVTEHVHDTTTVYVEVHDTVWLTEYIHDTVYIHDTIVVGVNEVDAINAKVYSSQGQIVVEGADGNTVTLYDLNGRHLATKQDYGTAIRFDVPATGT